MARDLLFLGMVEEQLNLHKKLMEVEGWSAPRNAVIVALTSLKEDMEKTLEKDLEEMEKATTEKYDEEEEEPEDVCNCDPLDTITRSQCLH